MRHILRTVLGAALLAIPSLSHAQRPEKTWEFVGVPALNFDADEGFGYGALLEAYRYAPGVTPYALTIQPTLFLTTRGRRDLVLFVDAPQVRGWRLTGVAAREERRATPYYGIGNDAEYNEAAEAEPNPYYYRYGRLRSRLTLDAQRGVAPSLRLLVGAAVTATRVDPTPYDSGTTLLAEHLFSTNYVRSRANSVRLGAVYDSRDREVGARRGVWSEVLVQHVARAMGSTHDFTRLTGSARAYVPLTQRVTWAQRFTAQHSTRGIPFQELSYIQTSFKEQEGLGGSQSIRGLPRNRVIGRTLALSNSELRMRAADFHVRAKPAHLVASLFGDVGRVWDDTPPPPGNGVAEAASAVAGSILVVNPAALHAGYGAGARLGYGQNFVVALDVGHSKETAAAIYIGLGYLF